MYAVSQKYKDAITKHRTRYVRDSSNISILLGQFDQTARGDAALASTAEASLSTLSNINADVGQECSYASWEGGFFELSGKQKFAPLAVAAAKRQGFISLDYSRLDRLFDSNPTITITYSKPHTMVGITLLFDDIAPAYPTGMNITTYLEDVEVQSFAETNDHYKYEGELMLEAHDKLVIEFTETVRAYQRIHLQQILFGIGYTFGSESLMKAEIVRIQDPISLELPAGTLDFTLHNENGRFAIDEDNNILNFFNSDQEVRALLGIDVTGKGTFEYVEYGPYKLSKWTVEGINAKFMCDNVLSRLCNTTYYKGVYTAAGIRADILAAAVLDDAGVTDYDVSNWELKIVTIKNPLPIDTHAACLQLIANLTMCVLDVSMEGTIIFRSRKAPVATYTLATLTDNYLLPVAAGNIVDYDLPAVEFATWEDHGFALDGQMKFSYEDPASSTDNTEFVYDLMPNEEGTYDTVYAFRLDFTANVSFGSVKLYFGTHRCPTHISLKGVRNNNGSYLTTFDKTYEITPGNPVIINDNFDRIVWLYVGFKRCDLQMRPRIQQIAASWDTGFGIESIDVLGYPQGEQLPLCRNVIIIKTDYTFETALSDVVTQDVEAGDWVHLEFSGPYIDVVATTSTVGASIEYVGYASACDVKVTGVVGEASVLVQGKKGTPTITKSITSLNTTGEDSEVSNPIIGSSNITAGLINWIADYFRTSIMWQPETLAFPMVEQHDLLSYKGVRAYITESVLTYEGGAREKFTLRKEVNT